MKHDDGQQTPPQEEIDDKIKDRAAHLEVALERSKFFNRYV